MTDWLKRKVDHLLAEGYDFPVAGFLSRGLELLRMRFWHFVGFALLVFIINTVVGFIPVLGFVATTFVLGPALNAGFFLFAERLDREPESAEFPLFFRGFDYVAPLALYTLVYLAILLLAFFPSLLAMGASGLFEYIWDLLRNPLDEPDLLPDFSTTTILILFINLLFLLLVVVAYWWTPLFIVFHQMPFWDAMEASRKLVARQLGSHVLLFLAIFFSALLIGIIAVMLALFPLIGILILGIYIAAVTVVFQCALYASFAAVVGVDPPGDDDQDDLLEHLIDEQ